MAKPNPHPPECWCEICQIEDHNNSYNFNYSLLILLAIGNAIFLLANILTLIFFTTKQWLPQ